MTHDQIARLPAILREIIDVDRHISAARARGDLTDLLALRKRREFLQAAAVLKWGRKRQRTTR